MSPGQTTTLTFSYCKPADDTDAGATGTPWVLKFDTAQEHEAWVVNSAGEHVWTWSSHHGFLPQAHSFTLATFQCADWSTTWDGRDDSGQRVPPGTYSFESDLTTHGHTLRPWISERVTVR